MGRRGRERQEEGAEPRETSLSTKQGAGAESALFVNVLRDSALALWVFSVLAYTGEGREAEHEVHTPVSFQHQKSQSPANSDASKPHHRAAHRQKKALLSRPPPVLGQKSPDHVPFAKHAPSSPRRHRGGRPSIFKTRTAYTARQPCVPPGAIVQASRLDALTGQPSCRGSSL